jgi:DNA-directed RNA polymerase specialized sigma24 family protein
MVKKSEIGQEDFESLLDWLDENRETAAQKYEAIRSRLIKIFVVQKHFDAENLADQVFDRVCRKLGDIVQTYEGKKELYFYGVARKIHLETKNQAPTTELNVNHPALENKEDEETQAYYKCLEKCLQELSSDDRSLVIGYYQKEKSAKIDYRKQIAERLDITLDNLRIRIFRLRNELKKCVLRCVKTA